MTRATYEGEGGSFEMELPEGWIMERDPEDGISIFDPEREGLLHLLAFERDPAEVLDPAEELYAFLYDQEIELEEDEVQDLELGSSGALALCEYLEEDEEEGQTIYWLLGVAGGPGQIVFANFSCPSSEAEAEEPLARAVLASIRFPEEGP